MEDTMVTIVNTVRSGSRRAYNRERRRKNQQEPTHLEPDWDSVDFQVFGVEGCSNGW